jgi:hypothetical protein
MTQFLFAALGAVMLLMVMASDAAAQWGGVVIGGRGGGVSVQANPGGVWIGGNSFNRRGGFYGGGVMMPAPVYSRSYHYNYQPAPVYHGSPWGLHPTHSRHPANVNRMMRTYGPGYYRGW